MIHTGVGRVVMNYLDNENPVMHTLHTTFQSVVVHNHCRFPQGINLDGPWYLLYYERGDVSLIYASSKCI